MNEDDSDLRAFFAEQRRADRADTPAWNPDLLQRRTRRPRSFPLVRPGLAAAACVLTLLLWGPGRPGSRPAEKPRLDLPPLFSTTEPATPLFASLVPPRSWPSDSLKPDHLNLIIP